jgi:hypothetical protein
MPTASIISWNELLAFRNAAPRSSDYLQTLKCLE